MSGKFDLGNYVEVDERITRFYDRYPEGRIATIGIPQVLVIDGKSFIVAQAGAWRTADDPQGELGQIDELYELGRTLPKTPQTAASIQALVNGEGL